MNIPGLKTEQLLADIRAFDQIGWHRTGSKGDETTSEWLKTSLADLGIVASLHEFSFPSFDLREARLEVDGQHYKGTAQFDAGTTGSAGVSGSLKLMGEDIRGNIAVAELGMEGTGATPLNRARSLIDTCEEAGAIGLVFVVRGFSGSIWANNAPSIYDPSSLPVFYAPLASGDELMASARKGSLAHLVVDASRDTGRATNVLGRLPANSNNPHPEPLVMLTPKSGWFHCAAERGGGIAIWLATARALVAMSERRREVIFLAGSGHEFGFHGSGVFLEENPELATGARAWIHLGASIGATYGARLRLFASDQELQLLAQNALKNAEAPPVEAAPLGASGGESQHIAKRGGRYISFAGGHAYFHTPEDRIEAVSIESVAGYARAVVAMATELALK